MANPFFKKLLPHLICILLFLVIISYFFMPHWEGKVMQQGDVLSWQGSAREILDYNKEHPGDPALWTGTMFSGMPAFQISTPMNYNLLNYVQSILSLGFLTGPVAIFFMCAVSFYVLYLVLGLSIPFAFMGSLSTFMVTGNFIVWEAGHLPKLIVLGMIGFILSGMIQAYRSKYLQGAALFALGIGINILNNHVQMSYYTFLLTLPLILSYFIYYVKEKKINSFIMPSLLLTVVLILAFLSSASSILPTYEYAKETMRGGHILQTKADQSNTDINTEGLQWDYAMNWSNGTQDLLSCLIPGAAGGGSSEPIDASSATVKDLKKKGYQAPRRMGAPLYWGDLPFTSGPFYFSALICFLFVLGLFIVKGPLKWWIAFAAVFGLLLSMGKNFEILNRFMFDHIPLYSKFRAPSSVLSVVSYFIPILGMLAIHEWIKSDRKTEELNKQLYYSAGITGGICLLVGLMGSGFFSFQHPTDPNYINQGFSLDALIDDRKSLLQKDAYRSLFIILAGAGILWLNLQNKIKTELMAGLFSVILLIDLGGVATRYVHKEDFVSKTKKEAGQKPRAVDTQILQDKSYYRVLDLSVNTFNSSFPSFFHNNVGGYHPAKLQRYQDIIDRHLEGEINRLSTQLQSARSDSAVTQILASLQVLNMLNTKYYILGQPGKEIPLANAAAFGPAWFVNQINWVKTPDEEITALSNQNLKTTAILHEEFKQNIGDGNYTGSGSIQLTSHTPNKLVYQTNSDADQLAVFSEVWYGPNLGWTLTIDGKESPLCRANYVLRAAKIPAGKHEVVMEFKPSSFHLGKNLSLICSLLLIGLIGFAGYKEFQQTKIDSEK